MPRISTTYGVNCSNRNFKLEDLILYSLPTVSRDNGEQFNNKN